MLLAAALLLVLAGLLPPVLVLWRRVWRPHAVARSFARQGIRGPPYRFPAGSLPEARRLLAAGRRGVPPLDPSCHDFMPVCLPPLQRWIADHGRTFVFWIGPIAGFLSTDLEITKQVLADRTGVFVKDVLVPGIKVIFSGGLIAIDGDGWKRHRKVILPAFSHEKIKSMSWVTAQVTEQMTQQWRDQIQRSGDGQAAEIDVVRAMRDLTTAIIGRVAFGTDHRETDEVLLMLWEMQKLGTAAMLDGPIFWYLPTLRNLRVRRVKKLLRANITAMMQARVAAKDAKCGYGDDLLGLLVAAWSPEPQGGSETLTMTTQEVVDECKTFFGAGQETTATLLVWTMFLLAVHQEWQDKVREEVLRECSAGDDGGQVVPSTEALAKLKLLYMVLLETLRLYPPIVYIQRRATSDVVLGGIEVPRDTVISIPIGKMRRDKEVWGNDADEFNPMRFNNGVSRAAKDPKALLSFSIGPRACIGQNFSIIEAQVIMVIILRKFSFSLSPKYVHKPKYFLSLTPKLGMPLILRNLNGK
ncbi:hypothetical protein ACP4OV_020982 [Aristida adscensionis]